MDALTAIVLTHPEKAADTEYHASDLAVWRQQYLVDVADLLVLLIVDIYADQFRSAPLA